MKAISKSVMLVKSWSLDFDLTWARHVLVNLLLKVMEIAFQTLFYPDTSIFV